MKLRILFCLLAWLGFSSSVSAQPADVFDSVVRNSIEKGRSYLLESLEEGTGRAHWARAYPMGFRALMAYALLEAGTSPDDERVRRLFRDLERRPMVQVYSVSLYVMALDSWWRHQTLRQIATKGRGSLGDEKMEGKLRTRLKKLTSWILSARWPDRGTWGYEHWKAERRQSWDDYSNTQFAVLALQVAMRHEVKVPERALREVMDGFIQNSWSNGQRTALECEGPGWWLEAPTESSGRTGVASGPVSIQGTALTLRSEPRAWGYRPGMGGEGVPGQYSMIAAATSSLMVCRRGLSEELNANELWDLDAAIAGGIIGLEQRFRTLYPQAADSIHRNYYYTLYSFEKAMDLGGIAMLGEIDWYRQQATVLTDDRGIDGGWGGKLGGTVGTEFRQVSTAFALLFLKRATRHLRVEETGPIVTGGEVADQPTGVREGKVHVASLGGTVDLGQVFGFLAEQRTREYLELAREIVASVPPEEVRELLPYLVGARRGGRDAVDRFVEETIRDLSGLPGDVPEPRLKAWLESYRKVQSFSRSDRAQGDRAQALEELNRRLRDPVETLPMKLAMIEALVRLSSLEGVPVLIEILTGEGPFVREASHRALTILTGRRAAYPDDLSAEASARLADDWTGFWVEQGDALRLRVEWDRLRADLDGEEDPEQRTRLVAEIVGLGAPILPFVDAILAGDRFPFEWVLIREQISGEKKGLSR